MSSWMDVNVRFSARLELGNDHVTCLLQTAGALAVSPAESG